MPLYDYDCAACGRRFEVIHGLNDPGPEHCPLCGKGPVRKAFAAPAIHFKGSGWAKKDRSSKPAAKEKPATDSEAKPSASSDGQSTKSATDSATSDSKA